MTSSLHPSSHTIERLITKSLVEYSWGWITLEQATEEINQRSQQLGQDSAPYLALCESVSEPGYQFWNLNDRDPAIDLGFAWITGSLQRWEIEHIAENCTRARIKLFFSRNQAKSFAAPNLVWLNGFPLHGISSTSCNPTMSGAEIEFSFRAASRSVVCMDNRLRVQVPPRHTFGFDPLEHWMNLPAASLISISGHRDRPLLAEELRDNLGRAIAHSSPHPLFSYPAPPNVRFHVSPDFQPSTLGVQRWTIRAAGDAEDFLDAAFARQTDYRGYNYPGSISITDFQVFKYKQTLESRSRNWLALKLKKALGRGGSIEVGNNLLTFPGLMRAITLPSKILLDTERYVWILTRVDDLIREWANDFSYTVRETALADSDNELMEIASRCVTAIGDRISSLVALRDFLDVASTGSSGVSVPSTGNASAEDAMHYIHRDIIERLRQGRAPKRTAASPEVCHGCKFHHGQVHGGKALVCAVHPSGPSDPYSCVDFEENS